MRPFSRLTALLILGLLLVVAAAISSHLAWASLSGAIDRECSTCSDVLQSRWAMWLGYPVALLGASACWLALLLLVGLTTAKSARRRQQFWRILFVVCTAISTGSVWFFYLQSFELEQICWDCCVANACCLLASVIIVFLAPIGRGVVGRHQTYLKLAPDEMAEVAASDEAFMLTLPSAWAAALTGCSLTVLLISGQIFFPPQGQPGVELGSGQQGSPDSGSQGLTETLQNDSLSEPDDDQTDPTDSMLQELLISNADEDSKHQRVLAGGKLILAVDQHLHLGPLEAKHVLVHFFDYTSVACRKFQLQLEVVQRRYPDQLTIVLIPVPQNQRCNKTVRKNHPRHHEACQLAATALAVYHCQPDLFPKFHRWMLSTGNSPRAKDVAAYARLLVGQEAFVQARNHLRFEERIGQCVSYFRLVGPRKLPKLIVGDRVVSGATHDVERIATIVRDTLGLPAVEAKPGVAADSQGE